MKANSNSINNNGASTTSSKKPIFDLDLSKTSANVEKYS